MKGRSLKKNHPWAKAHPATKRARPGSRKRDMQRREMRRKARQRRRERGPGCAPLGIFIIVSAGMQVWLRRRGTR
jgi:hypothetical protein